MVKKDVGEIFASYPVMTASLFGSRANGSAGKNSDYDYMVEFGPEYTATQYFDMWDELEAAHEAPVDIITPKMLLEMHPHFKTKVEKEMRVVYEKQ